MRVLQVYRDHFRDVPGGIERHVQDLAHGLATSHRMETVASAHTPRHSDVVDGVTMHIEREYARPGGAPLAPGVLRRARDDYDLVHVHSPNPTGELAGLRLPNPTALVVTYHADSERRSRLFPAYRRWMNTFLPRAQRVIVGSHRLIESSPILSTLSDRASFEVVPFGVDTNRFSPAHGVSPTFGPEPVVLFVGRLRYYKGLPQLIHAVAGMRARLVVVGDGAERATTLALCRALLPDRFTYLPNVTDEELVEVYRAAHVFCLPSTSRAEAFGLAAVEAMSCGVPVITTDVGTATSEINVDGVTGRVVPPDDVIALRSALEGTLQDEEARTRMGRAARSRAVEHFDQRLMLQRIASVYDRAVAEHRVDRHG